MAFDFEWALAKAAVFIGVVIGLGGDLACEDGGPGDGGVEVINCTLSWSEGLSYSRHALLPISMFLAQVETLFGESKSSSLNWSLFHFDGVAFLQIEWDSVGYVLFLRNRLGLGERARHSISAFWLDARAHTAGDIGRHVFLVTMKGVKLSICVSFSSGHGVLIPFKFAFDCSKVSHCLAI